MKKGFRILLLIACVLGFAGILAVNAESDARRKARYYYSIASAEEAIGHAAESYEYYKKAYQADPTYAEGGSAFGVRRLYNNIDTLQTMDQLELSLEMMRPYVDFYPDDVYEALNYGYVAGQLGHTDDAVKVLERAYRLHPENSNILLQLSDVYARAYDIDNAVEAIDRYESAEGLSSPVTTRKLSYLLANEDTVRALAEVTRLINSDPSDISFKILKGNLFDIIEMPDSAFAYYSEAEAMDPESSAAKFGLMAYYSAKGDSVQYDNKLYEVLLTEDLDLDRKADLLAQYLQTLIRESHDSSRGDYLFSVLESQYPHEPRVLDLAARYSAAKGDFKDAEEQISYALDLDPSNSTYWGQLMTYQGAGENPESALETYEKAKEHITPDTNLKIVYGSIAQLAKDYGKAIAIYKSLIADIDAGIQPDSVVTLRDVRRDISMFDLNLMSSYFAMLGDVYNLEGDFDNSYRSYENAIELNSSNNMAKNNYAYFMAINGGDLDKALELSRASLTGEDEHNSTYLDTFAWINYLKEDYDTALEYIEKAVEAQEEEDYPNAEIYNHYGDILLKLERPEDALAQWRKAEGIMSENKETEEDSYAELLDKINQYDK